MGGLLLVQGDIAGATIATTLAFLANMQIAGVLGAPYANFEGRFFTNTAQESYWAAHCFTGSFGFTTEVGRVAVGRVTAARQLWASCDITDISVSR